MAWRRDLEERIRRDRGSAGNLHSDRQPSAERRYRRARPYRASCGPKTASSTAAPNSPRPTAERRSPAARRSRSITARSKRASPISPGCPMSGSAATPRSRSLPQILVPDRVGPAFDVPNHGKTRGFHVHRVSANRWEFVRTVDGWRIKRRRLRPLDGCERRGRSCAGPSRRAKRPRLIAPPAFGSARRIASRISPGCASRASHSRRSWRRRL